MKRTGMLILTFSLQFQFIFAQSVELKLPEVTEEGLANLVSSSLLQTITFVLAGLAGAMAIAYLAGNLRMIFGENRKRAGYSPRYQSPTDPQHYNGASRAALSSLLPQLIPVDHDLEEEDTREETKGQRG